MIFTGTGMSDVVQDVFAGKADIGCLPHHRPPSLTFHFSTILHSSTLRERVGRGEIVLFVGPAGSSWFVRSGGSRLSREREDGGGGGRGAGRGERRDGGGGRRGAGGGARLVRTGFLEEMAAKGLTDLSYFKYIGIRPTNDEDGHFPLKTSTKVLLPPTPPPPTDPLSSPCPQSSL